MKIIRPLVFGSVTLALPAGLLAQSMTFSRFGSARFGGSVFGGVSVPAAPVPTMPDLVMFSMALLLAFIATRNSFPSRRKDNAV